MSYEPNQDFLGQTCVKCGYGMYVETSDYNDWWVRCNDCGVLVFCYEPMEHQARFHADPHKFRLYGGGFGSAKTSTCAAEMIRACLETPNGTGLIGAQTLPQLENTAKLEFKKMLTKELIREESVQKNHITLTNGYKVLFRSFDDEGKLRSLNLCHWWIEEGSEVKFDAFVQLTTRLRSNKTDRHFGIISTNPDLNWIRTEFLLKSEAIYGSEQKYHQVPEEINPAFSTHIAKTSANKYLPPDYYETVAKNRPHWWIQRYLEASFEFSEGQVYPQFSQNLVEPFEIPKHWERFVATDFGLRDPTVMLLGAVDPKKGIVYIYAEHYEANKAVPYHAEKMNSMLETIPVGKIRSMVADPSGQQRNKHDGRSLFDHYAEYGLYFKGGYNRIEAGIHKVYAYFEMGKLKIFNNLKHTIQEGINYKYKQQELESDKNADEKPIDKDNHAMDCLRYLTQELPDDPSQLINHSISVVDSYNTKKQEDIPFALQDDDDYRSATDWSMYY